MSSPAEKRCLYEVLGLSRDCTSDEIRSAYKRQALRCHPDKLIQSGVSPDVATAAFQELVNAYEVLSDPKERSWYDSHRSQIIFSDFNSKSKSSKGSVPDLFSFFTNSVFTGYSDTGKGFYKVYADVFDKIYANEINFATRLGLNPSIIEKAPSMGNLKSYYEQASAFYAYWLGFVTLMDFCWEDEYDVMAGLNRKSRRVMEDENNKKRKKARREYNDTVRGLAAFVKKRDKRVIDMQVKKKEMMEKKRVEEMLKKKELERQKMERAMAYKAPKWSEVEEGEDEEDEVDIEDEKNVNVRELYCVACGKRFKSDKQWKNHEQSKKHKEKIAELKEAFSKEDIEMGEEVEEEEEEEEDDDDIVEELQEQFEEHVSLEEKQSDEEVFVGAADGSSDEEVYVGADDGSSDSKGIDNEEEDSFLEAMISGHKKKSKATANLEKEEEGSDDDEDSFLDAMISGHKKSKAASASLEKEEKSKSDEEERFVDADNGDTLAKSEEEEEDSFLEAMISGHMKKKNVHKSQANSYPDAAEVEKPKPKPEEEEADFMEYNNTKSNRRNRRKDRSNKAVKEGITIPDQVELPVEEKTPSHIEEDNNGTTEDQPAKNQKPTKQEPVLKKKGKAKKDSNNPPQPPQGRKQNASSKPKSTSSVCETCGEDFGSKTKLHKHLNDSGHATLKHR